MIGEQLEKLGPAATADGVREKRALVRVCAGLEQDPDRLDPVVVERVRQRIRATCLRTGLEQQAKALRGLGLDRVVDRLAVVRIRAGLEQDAGQLGVVDDAGGAVERRHLAVLVGERRVRVGASGKKVAGEVGVREHRVTHVQERGPVPRAAGLVGVACPAAAEHETGPRIALDLRPVGKQRLSVLPSSVGRSLDERFHLGQRRRPIQPEAGATGRIRPPPPPA